MAGSAIVTTVASRNATAEPRTVAVSAQRAAGSPYLSPPSTRPLSRLEATGEPSQGQVGARQDPRRGGDDLSDRVEGGQPGHGHPDRGERLGGGEVRAWLGEDHVLAVDD